MLENFYTVIEKSIGNDSAAVGVRFNVQHPIFKGHFPQQPIVPGACLLQIAGELVSSVLQKNLRVMGAKNIKFLQLILPEKADVVTFDLSWEESDCGFEVKCSIVGAETRYAVMLLTLAD